MQTIIPSGKCPGCNKVVSSALIEDLPANRFMESGGYRAVSYLCPHCKTILGVIPSAVAIADEVVREIRRDRR